ncbi:glutactin-like [Topomyia yanbarensis]|uniref:glutactin-like n=1 Tax=Topomyia yanbarensis TaxID=2498891 RepID=UPI00273C0860|nr:glutactin-like [Topomyia yanbarensis]
MTTICGRILRGEILRKGTFSNRVAARAFVSTDSSENPIVELPGLGKLKGSITEGAWTGTKILQFLNIRYAEPADGVRRFKPPIPVQPWYETLDVSMPKLGSPMYNDMKLYTPEQLAQNQEDCINVSVYTKDVNGKKPVIVYIHGGNFFSGAASHFPPNYIMEKDVVLVVPQYRLGPLGFLSTRSENIPGNASIHDVKLAFEWVQQYISQFGGDPNQVTAMAQSSGGSMVSAMLYSPAIDTEKLFHKLILQSGSCFTSWSYDHTPVENSRVIAELAGCNPKANQEEVEQFLMEVDVYRLTKAFSKQYRMHLVNKGIDKIGGCRIVSRCPHGLFPTLPYQAMRKGMVRKNLPMLLGTMKHDGTFGMIDIFLSLAQKKLLDSKSVKLHLLIDEMNRLMGIDDPTCVTRSLQTALFYGQEVLAKNDLKKLIPGLSDVVATCLMKGPILKQAQLNATYQPDSTFLYSFDYAGKYTRFGFGLDTSQFPFGGGVHHCDDLIYLFPYPPESSNLNEADTQIAKRTVDLWTSFATDGIPRAEGVPEWPSMKRVCGPYMKIDKNCTIGENYLNEFTATLRDPSGIARTAKLLNKEGPSPAQVERRRVAVEQ